jgi:RecB family endonuclease NucS
MQIPQKPPYIAYANFSVEYEGRASSILEASDLILMRKPDGSTAIHGGALTIPLNYMGPKTTQEISDNILILANKKEIIKLIISKVYSVMIPDNWDNRKITLVKTEDDLRNKLMGDPAKYFGYTPTNMIKEFKTNHGPVDIALLDNFDGLLDGRNVGVVEVKRKKITLKHCYQAIRYRDALKKKGAKVQIWLAAPEISKNALEYCQPRRIKFVEVLFD